MVKHFCDRCDTPTNPMTMIVLSAQSRDGSRAALRSYDLNTDRYVCELCRTCFDTFAAAMGVKPDFNGEA